LPNKSHYGRYLRERGNSGPTWCDYRDCENPCQSSWGRTWRAFSRAVEFRAMPRFSIARLMVATALIASGLCCLRLLDSETFPLAATPWVWFSAGALIGIGALLPFRRPWFGLCAGLVVQAVIFAYIIWITRDAMRGSGPQSLRAMSSPYLKPNPTNPSQQNSPSAH
jgi:hypothetical protein